MNLFKQEVISTLYFPSSAEKPNKLIYALLALNAANDRSEKLDEIKVEKELFSKEVIHLLFITWYLHSLKGSEIIFSENKYKLDYTFTIAGKKTDKLLIPIGKSNFYFGSKDSTDSELINWLSSITPSSGDDVDTLKLDGRSFTAPRTGISPTSSFIGPTTKGKEGNRLTNFIRNGGDTQEVLQRIDNYTAIISGTNFFLGDRKAHLNYYFFPTGLNSKQLVRYIKALKAHIKEIDLIEKKLKKSKDSINFKNSTSEGRSAIIKRSQELKSNTWVKFFLIMPTSEFSFIFEKEVGAKAGKFYTWSHAYTNIDNIKLFMLVYHFNDSLFFSVHNTLEFTGDSLSEGWIVAEKERLVDLFFNTTQIDWLSQWKRWRKYIPLVGQKIKKDKKHLEGKSSNWEGAFYFIMLLNQIQSNTLEPQQSGNSLLKKFDKQMEIKMEENAQRIREYLLDVFRSDNEKVIADIDAKSSDYSRFVDTTANESKWQAVVDGLICGWALKTVSRKLRPDKDDYKKVIGGRSLSKMSPFEVNEKMIELREKVNRQDHDAWNVDAPMEKLLFYVQKKVNSEAVRLFSDALSLGFMRFDKINK